MNKRAFFVPVVIMTILMFTVLIYADNDFETKLKQVWDAKTNKMTYDEALIMLGQPSTVIQGDEIFITTWQEITEVTPSDDSGLHFCEPPGSLLGLNPEEVMEVMNYRAARCAEAKARSLENAESHGKSFQLTFNKKSRVMINWKYKEW